MKTTTKNRITKALITSLIVTICGVMLTVMELHPTTWAFGFIMTALLAVGCVGASMFERRSDEREV